MSDPSRTEAFSAQPPDIVKQSPPLPAWLADRLLGAEEKVTWVYGPRHNPSWERYITHPALFLVAVALGAVCLVAGWLAIDSGTEVPMLPVLAAGGIVLGSVLVLAISNGYFTRLVVTSSRLVILQGYEVCRTWKIDQLPNSLLRYAMLGGARALAVDLDALKTVLGTASDKFCESKTILALGKRLDQIKAREDGRP
jgi:hypothetical protein